jgi:gliding motility-associated-like protein
MFKYIFSAILCLSTITALGQTNAVWPTDGGYVHIQKVENPTVVQNNNRLNTMGYSMCNRKGELLFYGDGFGHHYNKNGAALFQSEKIKYGSSQTLGNISFQISEYEYILICGYKTSHSSGSENYDSVNYLYNLIDTRLDNGNGGVSNLVNVPILSGANYRIDYIGSSAIKVVRKIDFNYQVYLVLNDKIYSINYENYTFTIVDSTVVNAEIYVPESIKNLPNWQHTINYTVSPSNLALVLTFHSNVNQMSIPFSLGSNYLTIKRINIDQSSKFDTNNEKTIYIHRYDWNPLNFEYSNYSVNSFSDDAYSQNDSFLFFTIDKHNIVIHKLDSIETNYTRKIFQLAYKSDVLTLNGITHWIGDTSINLKKGINGDIWCLLKFINSGGKAICKIGKLLNPNSKTSYLSVISELSLIGRMSSIDFQYQVPEQIQLLAFITYDCVANISFKNNSNPYLAFDTFKWRLSHPNGTIDTFIGHAPLFTILKSGDYGLQVQGISSIGNGYSELYFDTLHIRIPEKPVADFMVSDTIACRFSPVQFFNSSRFMTVKPGEKVEYRWDFGDGETMVTSATTPIFHTYKQPGRFTVSLRISNGYCDSILIKSNFMRITDAPAPGFSVSATQGCAPFAPHFTDTVSENVTRKEYFFSDENQWVPITNNHFSHTFQKPGTYYAVQRLHGYTGCVTQTDTAVFYVSKGLTLADTAHTHWASYMTNERIDLAWPSVDGAVAYALYKNKVGIPFPSSPFKIVSDTFYLDVIQSPDRFTYAIKAIDSCGNLSSFGRIAQPILLSGSGSADNKTALLTFTPYQQWEDTIIHYSPEFLSDNGFIRLDILDKAGDFIDADFAQSGAVEKCYRIRADNAQFESFSNQICVPYSPFILMPTAFSPNDDGLNDVFIPITYGIESLKVKIYNRWGEKIIELKKGESWDGLQVLQGQYLVIFTGQAKNGEQFFLEKPLMLVR